MVKLKDNDPARIETKLINSSKPVSNDQDEQLGSEPSDLLFPVPETRLILAANGSGEQGVGRDQKQTQMNKRNKRRRKRDEARGDSNRSSRTSQEDGISFSSGSYKNSSKSLSGESSSALEPERVGNVGPRGAKSSAGSWCSACSGCKSAPEALSSLQIEKSDEPDSQWLALMGAYVCPWCDCKKSHSIGAPSDKSQKRLCCHCCCGFQLPEQKEKSKDHTN